MPVLGVYALVGVLLGLWVEIPGTVLLLTPIFLAAASFAWWLGGGKGVTLVLGLTISTLQCHWYLDGRLPPGLLNQNLLVTGTVADFPVQRAGMVRLAFRLNRNSAATSALANISLSVYDEVLRFRPGECWQLLVRLKPPQGLSNSGLRDRAVTLMRDRLHATGYVRHSELNQPVSRCDRPDYALLLRDRYAQRLEGILGEHSSFALLEGITLGKRSGLEQTSWQVLRQTGTSHLLAISGLHIGLVAAFVWRLSCAVGIAVCLCRPGFASRTWAAGLTVAAALGYAMLAGFSIPTIRAAGMVTIVVLFTYRQRLFRPMTILAAILVAALLHDPFSLLSAAFWLSYAAVAILACTILPASGDQHGAYQLGPPISRFVSAACAVLGRWVRTQCLLTLGLALPTLVFFSQLSLIAPLANLVAIPIFSFAILPIAFTGLALLPLWEAGAAVALTHATHLLGWLMGLLTLAARVPGAFWDAGQPGWLAIILLFAGVGCLLLPRPARSWLLGLGLITTALLLRHASGRDGLLLEVLDVGQGLAVLVRIDGKTLLYDTGPRWQSSDAGARIILPILRNRGVHRLDLLVLSHWDSDHSGGLASLQKALPDTLILAPRPGEEGSSVRSCRQGMGWNWGAVRIAVLHPAKPAGWSDNDSSCVILLQSPSFSALLPGDIEKGVEPLIARNLLPDSLDLLLVPHHGSKTSSSPAFVLETRPRYAIFSTGYANRWNFPAPEVAQRWMAVGACSLNTATSGALTFRPTAQGQLIVEPQKASPLRPWPIRTTAGAPCKATL